MPLGDTPATLFMAESEEGLQERCEIDPSLLEDIERIDAALTEYAKDVQAGRVPPPTRGDNVTYLSNASQRLHLLRR